MCLGGAGSPFRPLSVCSLGDGREGGWGGLLAQPVRTTQHTINTSSASALLYCSGTQSKSERGRGGGGWDGHNGSGNCTAASNCLGGRATQMRRRLGTVMITGWRVERASLGKD